MAKACNCAGPESLLNYILGHSNRCIIVYVLSDRKHKAEIKSSNAIQNFFSLKPGQNKTWGSPTDNPTNPTFYTT